MPAAGAATRAAHGLPPILESRRTGSLRVLILEDEAFTGLEVADLVTSAGHDVSALCRDESEALRRIAVEPPDFAVLDVKLENGGTSEAVARRLAELSIPFTFLTAYVKEHSDLLREFDEARILSKPLVQESLLAELSRRAHAGGARLQ